MSIVFYIVTETLPLYVSKNAMSGNWDAGLDVVQLPLPRKPTEKHHLYTTCQPELGHPVKSSHGKCSISQWDQAKLGQTSITRQQNLSCIWLHSCRANFQFSSIRSATLQFQVVRTRNEANLTPSALARHALRHLTLPLGISEPSPIPQDLRRDL